MLTALLHTHHLAYNALLTFPTHNYPSVLHAATLENHFVCSFWLHKSFLNLSWIRDSKLWFHLNGLYTGSLLVLCGVQFYLYLSFFVDFLATPCMYFVFIKSLKLSYIPYCVWYSGLVGHSHVSVCAWVQTENREYSIIVVLIITNNSLFDCYSFNSWFSADVICEISQATASIYSLCRMGC